MCQNKTLIVIYFGTTLKNNSTNVTGNFDIVRQKVLKNVVKKTCSI